MAFGFFRNWASFHNGKEDHRAFIKFISSDISMRVRLDQFRLTENLLMMLGLYLSSVL